MTPRTALALLLAMCASARAAEPSPDARAALPGPEHGKASTCDATPVEPGSVEVEVGYAPTWDDRAAAGAAGGEAASTHGFTAALTYGALPDVDLRVSAGFASAHDPARGGADGSGPTRAAGVTDAHLGARWRFLHRPGAALEVAVAAEVVVPVGARSSATAIGLTQDHWSARAALVATKDLGPLTASAEIALGAPFAGDAHGLRSTAQANCAAGWQLAPWLQPELELNYGLGHALGGDAHVLAATAGVVAPFGAGQRVVAAVQQGLWALHATPATAGILAFKTAL
ncbi:MAG TPA: transporter [Anaeromyxobacteraceae bacterium]|nr:transporter [Anaeromyxobacteraceae bacterium]